MGGSALYNFVMYTQKEQWKTKRRYTWARGWAVGGASTSDGFRVWSLKTKCLGRGSKYPCLFFVQTLYTPGGLELMGETSSLL